MNHLVQANGTTVTLVDQHIYRVQVMVHDGDQNKSGGDVGEACTKFQYLKVPGAQTEFRNNSEVGEVMSADPQLPKLYALHDNYPNPFNPTTQIRFDLPEKSQVRLTVFNSLGQQVATIVSDLMEAGFHSVEWNSSNSSGLALPSGVYIYRFNATSLKSGEEFTDVKKMLLMK